jgi:hypothetical protein
MGCLKEKTIQICLCKWCATRQHLVKPCQQRQDTWHMTIGPPNQGGPHQCADLTSRPHLHATWHLTISPRQSQINTNGCYWDTWQGVSGTHQQGTAKWQAAIGPTHQGGSHHSTKLPDKWAHPWHVALKHWRHVSTQDTHRHTVPLFYCHKGYTWLYLIGTSQHSVNKAHTWQHIIGASQHGQYTWPH